MQHCDESCSFCFRGFIAWLKARLKSQDHEAGRSGGGSFNAAAGARRIEGFHFVPVPVPYPQL